MIDKLSESRFHPYRYWQGISLLIVLLFGFTAVFSQREANPLYLDPNQSIDARLTDLMGRMTLEEKVAQMCQYVGLEHMKKAERALSVEEMKKSDAQGFYPGLFSSDVAKMTEEGLIGSFLHVLTAEEANHLQQLAAKSRLGIPVLIGIDAIHGNALVRGTTVYPSPISIASGWNDSLSYVIGQQTAREMRATGSHWAFTPNIDVMRDPRWGRCGETFGEDPVLVGNMGVAQIRGMQSDDFTGPDHVIACAKHLIAGSESVNGLNSAPTDLSMRTLHEIFLPPYKRAIQEAGVFSIMAAHNELNGIPCHSHHYLMTELLREDWGFDGFYVSDWNDISRIWNFHHTAESFEEASLQSVSAGMDMNMHGPGFFDHIVSAVRKGLLDELAVDRACSKILEAKFRLGLFENPFVDTTVIDQHVFIPAHRKTTLETARQSMVLLKNTGILPLDPAKFATLFVAGPNADNMTILGDWAKPQPDDHLITVYEGIRQMAAEEGIRVYYYPVEERSKLISDQSISEAIKGAADADAVVLVLGENSFRHDWENKTTGENIDRSSLQLSGRQLELAMAVKETGKPLIIVLVNGSPVSEPWLEEQADAILEAWEPGSMGGQAVAEILFGKINPSGKLPVTVPRSVGQLLMVYNHKPSMYKHKYHNEPKTPLYPFGFGLSYTDFSYSDPRASSTELRENEPVTISVVVENTGAMDGDEIVQLYIRDDYSQVTRPVKELKAYRRIHLKVGESKAVDFELSPEMLAYYNAKMEFVVEKGSFTIMTGPSSRDEDLKKISLEVSHDISIND